MMLITTACQQKPATGQKDEFRGVREVKVSEAQFGDISSYLEFSGRIVADDALNLKPALGGKVLEMHVREGNLVKKGDLLAKLDDTQLRQAQVQFEAAEKNYLRLHELYNSGAIDAASFEEMETGYNLAKTSLEFIRKNTLLTAPIDGVITHVYKKQNENFDAMMDPFLIRLVNLKKIKAAFQVSDADINHLKTGQSALLNVNSSGEDFSGRISYISPEADAYSGTFKVEITAENRDNQLRNNQFARIRVFTQTSRNAVFIPQKAVLNNAHVFSVEAGKAVLKIVETGIGNEYEIEIKSGLEKGAVVVVTGNIGLSDGDVVKIVE